MTESVGDMQQRAKGNYQAVGTQLVYILTELAGCPKIVFRPDLGPSPVLFVATQTG